MTNKEISELLDSQGSLEELANFDNPNLKWYLKA